MNLSTLEQIVGPINRGQLAGSFKHDIGKHHTDDEPEAPINREKVKPPPLTEDLTYLNHSFTRRASEAAKESWAKMNRTQRKKRIDHLKTVAKIGGGATKGKRHLKGT